MTTLGGYGRITEWFFAALNTVVGATEADRSRVMIYEVPPDLTFGVSECRLISDRQMIIGAVL